MNSGVVFVCVAISVVFQISLVTSDYVMPVPGDCTKYQVCDYSGCFVFNCGIGTEFNPRILVCDYPLRDRGACGIRDNNIGPTIPYPGRAINYPAYQDPYQGSSVPNNGYPGNPGSPGYPGSPGNPGYPGSPGNPGYPSSGNPNPAVPAQGCPVGCG